MFDLDDFNARILLAVASGPIAWQTPAELSERIGQGLDSTTDALANLDAEGWLDPWEVDDAVYVTLSPRASARLGVRLAQIGRSDRFRWISSLDPEPSPPVARGRGMGLAALLDTAADPSPGPEAIAEATERAEQIAADRAAAGDRTWLDWLPRPKILLGQGLSPWPGPVLDPADACPGCRSGPLDPTSYCLVCDRWGLDHLLKTRKGRRPSPTGRTGTPVWTAQEAAAARAFRKAKRRKRLQEKVGRERLAQGRV